MTTEILSVKLGLSRPGQYRAKMHPCNRASADEVFREFDGHHRSKLLTTEQTLRQPKEPLSAVTAAG